MMNNSVKARLKIRMSFPNLKGEVVSYESGHIFSLDPRDASGLEALDENLDLVEHNEPLFFAELGGESVVVRSAQFELV